MVLEKNFLFPLQALVYETNNSGLLCKRFTSWLFCALCHRIGGLVVLEGEPMTIMAGSVAAGRHSVGAVAKKAHLVVQSQAGRAN